MADGNPVTRRALEAAGCEVHGYPAHEIGVNGSGGPTCLAPGPSAGMSVAEAVGGTVAGAVGDQRPHLRQPDAAEQAAADAVNPAAVHDDLLALCAIPSVTGAETAARDHLARILEADRLDVHTWDADPIALAADPAFPGMEVPRTTLPLVAGTLRGHGRAGGSSSSRTPT